MILQIGLQILLPAFLLVGLWRGAFRSRPEWLLNVLAVSAALLFVFLTAHVVMAPNVMDEILTLRAGVWFHMDGMASVEGELTPADQRPSGAGRKAMSAIVEDL